MELTYDGVALHGLGEVILLGEKRTGTPEACPQRNRVVMRARVEFFEATWRDNYDQVRALQTALAKQHGVLRWVDPAAAGEAQELLNQTVEVLEHDRSEPNEAGGTRQQRLELAFAWWEAVNPQNEEMWFTDAAGGAGQALGGVTRWSEGYAADRVSGVKSVRRTGVNRVEVSGQFLAAPTGTLAARRKALQELKDALLAEVNGKEGTLRRGSEANDYVWSKVVRVESLRAEVNQAADAIDWTLAAVYNLLPAGADFAWVEYEASEREQLESGKKV